MLRLSRTKRRLIALADRARDAGQWEIAAQYYRKALDRNPHNSPIWVQYGHALKESGHLAEAETAYRRALADAPELADSHLQLGHVLKLQGKIEEAKAAYLRGLMFARLSTEPLLREIADLGLSESELSELGCRVFLRPGKDHPNKFDALPELLRTRARGRSREFDVLEQAGSSLPHADTDRTVLDRRAGDCALVAQSLGAFATAQIADDWRENPYYEDAEQPAWLDIFWGEASPFRARFDALDPSVLVELACGRGRHTARLLDGPAGRIVRRVYLVDVNEENIVRCKDRFRHDPRMILVRNNGTDLLGIPGGEASALFCYDAMVHFEWDVVISYLGEAHRVLRPGGRALFHHSNFDQNPGAYYSENPHARNFMSKNLFAHAARRVGFAVSDQQVIDWDYPALDCITLLEKA